MKYAAVVDDEKDLREILELNLSGLFEKVRSFASGREFLATLPSEAPDIVLLDIMMENQSGYEVLSEIRKKLPLLPVIFLTARTQVHEKVLGLDLGADDYITKPFHKAELLSRIKAVLRRKAPVKTGMDADENKLYRFKTLVFDPGEKKLSIDGLEMVLTRTEYLILRMLSGVPGKIYSREDFLERVWEDTVINERTIDVHVKRLRKKLGQYRDIVKTHTGFGYSIVKSE